MALTGLAKWLDERFGVIGDQLAWADARYEQIVTDVLEVMDISTEAEASATALHAVGTWQFYEAVVADTSMDIDFSADGASYKRSQMFENAQKQSMNAFQNAMSYLDGSELTITEDVNTNPYAYDESRDALGNF